MDNATKVSVPASKAPGNPTTQPPIKTGSAIKGFGAGGMDRSLEGNDKVTTGDNGKGRMPGGGLIPGKV